MEYLVMECGLSYAVVMDAEGRFLKVPNLGYTVGQRLDEVLLLPERPAVKMSLSKQIIRWGAMAACLCLLMLGGWFWQSPIGTVRIKINPDVQLKINRFDAVVAAQGLNEDGAVLLQGYRSYGKEMETVAEELADRAVEMGYLSEGGKITLTVGSNRDEWRGSAEKKLRQELENHVEKSITVEIAGSGPDGTSSTPPKQEAAVPMTPDEKPERPSAAEDIEKQPERVPPAEDAEDQEQPHADSPVTDAPEQGGKLPADKTEDAAPGETLPPSCEEEDEREEPDEDDEEEQSEEPDLSEGPDEDPQEDDPDPEEDEAPDLEQEDSEQEPPEQEEPDSEDEPDAQQEETPAPDPEEEDDEPLSAEDIEDD